LRVENVTRLSLDTPRESLVALPGIKLSHQSSRYGSAMPNRLLGDHLINRTYPLFSSLRALWFFPVKYKNDGFRIKLNPSYRA
jgi:hypothetical protein